VVVLVVVQVAVVDHLAVDVVVQDLVVEMKLSRCIRLLVVNVVLLVKCLFGQLVIGPYTVVLVLVHRVVVSLDQVNLVAKDVSALILRTSNYFKLLVINVVQLAKCLLGQLLVSQFIVIIIINMNFIVYVYYVRF
jgi:hypothetical protein